MQLSTSTISPDAGLAGLMLGASTGVALPTDPAPSCGDAFAAVLANASAPALPALACGPIGISAPVAAATTEIQVDGPGIATLRPTAGANASPAVRAADLAPCLTAEWEVGCEPLELAGDGTGADSPTPVTFPITRFTPLRRNPALDDVPTDEAAAVALASVVPSIPVAPPVIAAEPDMLASDAEHASVAAPAESDTDVAPVGISYNPPTRPVTTLPGIRMPSPTSAPANNVAPIAEGDAATENDDRVATKSEVAPAIARPMMAPEASAVVGSMAEAAAPVPLPRAASINARQPAAANREPERDVVDPITAATVTTHVGEFGMTAAPAVPVAAAGRATEIAAPATEVPPAADDAANIAEISESQSAERPPRGATQPRNFVTALEKRLTPHRDDLGTGVAKPNAAMPYASTLPRSASADFEPATLLVDRATLTADVASPSPAVAPDAVSTAHRAVEAVLTAVQQARGAERHTVSLQFSVAGADLNVRVELRADEVRATFRTDSAELRAALAQEWDSAGLAAGDRGLRLAPPIFASDNGSNWSASSGEQAPNQHRRSAGSAPEFFVAARGASTSGSADPTRVGSVAISSAPRRPLSTALHLHTLA
jgi:hypothetical protein